MKPITAVLAEIPDLVAEVWATRDAPNPAPRADRHIHTPPGSKAPANLAAIDLLRTDPLDGIVLGAGTSDSHLYDRLGMCCRMVEEERADDGLAAPTVDYGSWSGRCAYLVSTIDWWLARLGVSEDVEHDIRHIHAALERGARVPHEIVYHCDRCGNRLIQQEGGDWMRCEGCFQQVPSANRVREKVKATKPMTASAIERQWGEALGLRAKTISEWKRRDLLVPVGEVLINGTPCPLYEPWEVMRVHWRHAGGVDLAEVAG